jgi:hyperosmotically inducible protein
MLGSLVRLLLIVIVIVAAIAFFAGYRFSGGELVGPAEPTGAVGTTGSSEPIDTSRARERGAAAGEKVAQAGNRAVEVVSDASLTAKIKSKMALDDTVKALDINVTTSDRTVTLSGRVGSEQEKKRALALARETDGVRSVVDRLTIR